MRSIPEYRVVQPHPMGLYCVEDEYGERPTNHGFLRYHDALQEAARLSQEAIDNYDGGEP